MTAVRAATTMLSKEKCGTSSITSLQAKLQRQFPSSEVDQAVTSQLRVHDALQCQIVPTQADFSFTEAQALKGSQNDSMQILMADERI